MLFSELIDGPGGAALTEALNGRRLDLIAPFARKWPLNRILAANHDRVRIIVRLPLPSKPLPARLDNDPRDLLDLANRMGDRVKIYALPGVHTKLYLNGDTAFFGSANFTSAGFGGGLEALLRTTDPRTYAELKRMFARYREKSTKVSVNFLARLSRKFNNGDFDYTATPEKPVTLSANALGDDEGDFRSWLVGLGEEGAQYIENRFDHSVGYNMTGHTQSAFPGLRAFLRNNLDLIPGLAGMVYQPYAFWPRVPQTEARLKQFVETQGHLFPGNGGGPWRNKLPTALGGAGNAGGGRGSGLIARMLIYLSRYAIDEGF